jgi:hypothetical protein
VAPIAPKETERQYRVARQTLSIHAFLRDRFAFKSTVAEIALLVCSVVFCATTFAADDLYQTIGLSPATARVALGLASVVAFAFSLTLLVVNWKDAWADHKDASKRWTEVVEKFKSMRGEDGTWPEPVRDQLNALYWDTARTTARSIAQHRAGCESQARRVFNHALKIRAIGSLCERVADEGFYNIRRKIESDGLEFLRTFAFIGPTTSYHLAKNIGLDVW